MHVKDRLSEAFWAAIMVKPLDSLGEHVKSCEKALAIRLEKDHEATAYECIQPMIKIWDDRLSLLLKTMYALSPSFYVIHMLLVLCLF